MKEEQQLSAEKLDAAIKRPMGGTTFQISLQRTMNYSNQKTKNSKGKFCCYKRRENDLFEGAPGSFHVTEKVAAS